MSRKQLLRAGVGAVKCRFCRVPMQSTKAADCDCPRRVCPKCELSQTEHRTGRVCWKEGRRG